MYTIETFSKIEGNSIVICRGTKPMLCAGSATDCQLDA